MPHSLPGFKSDSGLQVVIECVHLAFSAGFTLVLGETLVWMRGKASLGGVWSKLRSTTLPFEFMPYLSGSQKSKKLNSSLCQTACVIEGVGVAGVTRGPEHIFQPMHECLESGFGVQSQYWPYLSKGVTLHFKTPHFLE